MRLLSVKFITAPFFVHTVHFTYASTFCKVGIMLDPYMLCTLSITSWVLSCVHHLLLNEIYSKIIQVFLFSH